VKYSAYGVGSNDSQSQYFQYVDLLNLTVEKIPYNIEAAAAAVVGSNHPIRSTFPVVQVREQVAGCSKNNSRPMTLGAYMHDSISFFALAQTLKLWLR
jgi:hypothetical protein